LIRLLACMMLLVTTHAWAQCSSILKHDFAATPEAPTQLMSATVVPESATAPAHCLVSAYIAPNVGVDVRLPLSWNGKLAMVGCGGFCGHKPELSACAGPLRKGYACVATDMGHQSTGWDAKWAYNNLQAALDFGSRATHVSAVSGQAMVSAYYGKAPRQSYFMGCSTGGRQAYVEAERYPQDFDGIIAGAPIMSEAEDDLTLFWNVLATLAPDGHQVFDEKSLQVLHTAVVAACDMNDGIKDGLIGDPRQCHFDPAVLQCSASRADGCLNDEQIAAARKIYQGPVTSTGQSVSKAVVLPGSELNWMGAYVGVDGRPADFYSFIGDALQYLLFTPAPGPNWQPRDIDWDHDPDRTRTLESVQRAESGLAAFRCPWRQAVGISWVGRSLCPALLQHRLLRDGHASDGRARAHSGVLSAVHAAGDGALRWR